MCTGAAASTTNTATTTTVKQANSAAETAKAGGDGQAGSDESHQSSGEKGKFFRGAVCFNYVLIFMFVL